MTALRGVQAIEYTMQHALSEVRVVSPPTVFREMYNAVGPNEERAKIVGEEIHAVGLDIPATTDPTHGNGLTIDQHKALDIRVNRQLADRSTSNCTGCPGDRNRNH